jgi:isopropylmalate/homocitrate/citramalate synthase
VRVIICDVGPRDGLQNEPESLAPAVRAELVSRLAEARIPRVEVVSFVRDDLVPQMAGAEQVVELAQRGAAELSGLVLNERGYERFASTGLDRVNCTLAATETFNQRNGNATVDEAVGRVSAIAAAASEPVTVTVSCAWGCPFEGEVDPGAVADLCERLDGAGELVLADTIGVATPRRVQRLVERVSILGKPVGAHLHNTRNTGYAGAWGALEGGATVLDASVGGLGGCPFSPQATGRA